MLGIEPGDVVIQSGQQNLGIEIQRRAEHTEFIAPNAGHHVRLAESVDQDSGEVAQEDIASLVAVAVIDVLLTIHIHEQDGGLF